MLVFELLRFVSAVFVALVHYQYLFDGVFFWDTWATSAVTYFFMLSGFVLAHKYHDLEWKAVKIFYVRRLIRIYPIYLLAILYGFFLVYLGYEFYGREFFDLISRPIISGLIPEIIPDAIWFETFWKHLTFLQLWEQPVYAQYLPNPPLWSLTSFMLFYLCFPLFMSVLRHLSKVTHILVLFVVLFIVQGFLIHEYSAENEIYQWFTTVYTNPFIRIFECVMGILLYQLYRATSEMAGWKPGLLSFLMAYVAYGIAINMNQALPYSFALYFYLIPFIALILFTGAHIRWQPGPKLSRFIGALGGASFILYCFHWPAMEMANYLNITPESVPVHHYLTMATLIVLSLAVYLGFEKPVHKALRKLIH